MLKISIYLREEISSQVPCKCKLYLLTHTEVVKQAFHLNVSSFTALMRKSTYSEEAKEKEDRRLLNFNSDAKANSASQKLSVMMLSGKM